MVEVKTPIILGSHSRQDIGLVQKMLSMSQPTVDANVNFTEEYLQKNYSDLFHGIGCSLGKPKIHLREQQVVSPQKCIYVALPQKVKHKLKTLEQEGSIVP
jgi:hypothetical protein